MRILFAEDEVELNTALSTIFKRSGFTVDSVFNGLDALEYLKKDVYDVAVMDIMMPKMDGLSVVREVRANGNRVPILLLTAKSEIDDRVDGLNAGADDYLPKPFSTKELIARINALARRNSVMQSTELSFGNAALNKASFELLCGDQSVRLSNKEYQIMEMLMLNSKSVISSETIFNKVWSYDSSADINVVWVYVAYIRKKLQQINVNFHIKAIRNLGYILEMNNV